MSVVDAENLIRKKIVVGGAALHSTPINQILAMGRKRKVAPKSSVSAEPPLKQHQPKPENAAQEYEEEVEEEVEEEEVEEIGRILKNLVVSLVSIVRASLVVGT